MSELKRLRVGRVADARGEWTNVLITVEDDTIVEVAPDKPNASADIIADDGMLLPGFIDIHVHGGAGRSVMEGAPDAIAAIGQHLARHGVTGFLPTTVTASREDTINAIEAAGPYMRNNFSEARNGATILGFHLEGPYINPKRKGAQPEQFILPPDWEDFKAWGMKYYRAIAIMTLAPEMPGALEFIRELVKINVVASIGHTDATYEQVSAAIAAGARHVTHCYNAMRQLGSREPGVVGAAFSRPELTAELIWDNVHVHPASCRALINTKGTDGVILISDGIPGAGMADGYEFSLGDLPVTVQNGEARLPDGTLAGSLLTLDGAFANASAYTLPQIAAMTSRNAAVSTGFGWKYGLIAPGYYADFVILDKNGKVRQTWVFGRMVYEAAS